MGIKQSIEKTLVKFGKNNSPTVVAMGIATAKGIFRPTFTMMDKKENYETKSYTAIREGLTELIAIPVYYLSGVASKAVTKKLAVAKNFMPKDIYKKHLSGDKSKEVLDAVKQAESLAKDSIPKIGTTTAFIGVCLSALLVIPLICSVTIKPIMKGIEKRRAKKKEEMKTVNKPNPVKKNKTNLNTFKSLYNYGNSGMKVGGV